MKTLKVRAFPGTECKISSFRPRTAVNASSGQEGDDTSAKILAGPLPAATKRYQNSVELNRAGMRVTYSRKVRRITLQRYLVSKIVWRPEKVTFPELLTLYDNLLWCQDKSLTDPAFKTKFGEFLENLTVLLKNTRFSEKTYASTLVDFSPRVKKVAEGHLIPERNLHTVERHVLGQFHVLPTRSSGIPTRELPPVKVIGRGYRDKGTYRDPAWDGSPSWQELATYFARLENDED